MNVEVTESDARVSMSVIIDYGESIPDVAQAIRDNVVRRIEATTGLHCAAVDIAVTDLYFPGDDDEDARPPRRAPDGRTWSSPRTASHRRGSRLRRSPATWRSPSTASSRSTPALAACS